MLETPTHDDDGRPLRKIRRYAIPGIEPKAAYLVLAADDATGLWKTGNGWIVHLAHENDQDEVIAYARERRDAQVAAERTNEHHRRFFEEMARVHDLSQGEIIQMGRTNRHFGAEWRALRHPVVLCWPKITQFQSNFAPGQSTSSCISSPEFTEWFADRGYPIAVSLASIKKARVGREWRRLTAYVFDFPTIEAAVEFRFRWL